MSEKIPSFKKWACTGTAWGLMATLLGCSSAKPPLDTLATADAALSRAIDTKAAELAPLELHLAREELDSAKRAMDAEEYNKARRLAEKALVDAKLAETKARSESARGAAREAQSTIDALRREAEQKAPGEQP